MFVITEEPFGWRGEWIAIRSASGVELIDFMKTLIVNASEEDIREIDSMFVKECKDGWVLLRGALSGTIINYDELDKFYEEASTYEDFCSILKKKSIMALGAIILLSELSLHFGTVCYFSNFPNSKTYGWTKFEKGQLVRSFYSEGEQGIVINEGIVTPEEKMLPIRYEISSDNFPSGVTEEQVIQIASEWTCDPTQGIE